MYCKCNHCCMLDTKDTTLLPQKLDLAASAVLPGSYTASLMDYLSLISQKKEMFLRFTILAGRSRFQESPLGSCSEIAFFQGLENQMGWGEILAVVAQLYFSYLCIISQGDIGPTMR